VQVKACQIQPQTVSNKAKKRQQTTNLTRKLNLTTKYEIEKVTDWKDKRFSFFADPQKRKAESRPTFGTLPFARHKSQRFAKVKEPNLADTQFFDCIRKELYF